MASETFVQPAIPRFDGHYDHWRMLMENFLRSKKEYWDVVESGVVEPTARMSEAQKAELEALKLKDLKAKNYLFQAIDRTILETILCKDTSKQIWDSMKKKYQGTTKTKRQQLQALRSEFEILRMKDGETVTDYFSKTMAIVNKLRTHGDKTQDVTVVEKILRSMTPKYNFVVCAIEEANDLDEMSLEELESSLLVHERKLNRQEQNEQALKATIGTSSSFSNRSNRGRGRGRGRNQQNLPFEGRGRGRGRFQISYRPKSADRSKVECFLCHKYGHYQSKCRANLPNNEGEKSNFAQIEEEISLLMAAFSTLDESFRDNVKFGDNSKVSVRGRGQVTIQIRGNAAQTISNVLYVPELKTNLLTFRDAVLESKWRKAMDEEIATIERNNSWELTELPKGKKTIGVKWVYKTKLKENGEVDKYKACLVAKGYKQEFGVDYQEVFAPVVRHDTIRLVISLAAQNSWPVFQLDVKSAFLHGDLDEQVFIEQPPGYVKVGNEHKVYKLKRALYGLKQAPRAWYSRIEAYFLKEGFQKCPYEHTLFTKTEGGKMLIVCLYVDDLIYTRNDKAMFDKFKKSMMAEFDMSDLGLMHYYLGIEVDQSAAGIFISQKKYVQDILDRFRMKECNPVSTPIDAGMKLAKNPEGMKVNSTLYKQIVGSLMYLTTTRPDIMHAVSLISRYMESPKEMHLLAAKRILRYLKGTVEYGLFYKKGEKSDMFGFTDSDFARDVDDRKSTSGYVFMMGTTAVSWSSRK
ncbi:hypothetical protein SLEP1_g53999 [Rubroshorea leprosula]|uniref:Reverse transcriptase Ty1/copia-type domain-containing protein n=1 Tax=Rubroshorea leprosula TaxID=152421 RepID=A0AAV5MB13_9ROSI|nr:hypothetical protein SLEP1_g53999 [Rubroshorea leprosula]